MANFGNQSAGPYLYKNMWQALKKILIFQLLNYYGIWKDLNFKLPLIKTI